MPRYIAKLADNEYVEWSTVVDAPVTYIMTRDEMIRHLDSNREVDRSYEAMERVKRADARGTSCISPIISVEELISCNRAGDKETELTLEQIREKYRR